MFSGSWRPGTPPLQMMERGDRERLDSLAADACLLPVGEARSLLSRIWIRPPCACRLLPITDFLHHRFERVTMVARSLAGELVELCPEVPAFFDCESTGQANLIFAWHGGISLVVRSMLHERLLFAPMGFIYAQHCRSANLGDLR